MTRTMYDSDNPFAIPADTQMVAGYVDGRAAWPQAGWDRFPNAVKVRIACNPRTNDGHVLDVEPGCASPGAAPDWVIMRRASGIDPSLYVNRSNWQTVRDALAAAGVAPVPYWVSTLDGTRDIAGAIAVQYCGAADSNNPCRSAGHYDLSEVADFWPGVDSAPTPTPFSFVSGGGSMVKLILANGNHLLAWIGTDFNVYRALGVSDNELIVAGSANLTGGSPLQNNCEPKLLAGSEGGGFYTLYAVQRGSGRIHMAIWKDDGSLQQGWQPMTNGLAAIGYTGI